MSRVSFPEGVTTESFLRLFWQRKPLLMRGALSDYSCPLDADELAGLACEPDIESRLVLEHGTTPWEVRHGPFDSAVFAALPGTHWSLLVQDVDKHIPDVARLLDRFRFIPEWRIDDVMISYACDQGSVGPHTDQYDVFLFQAQGNRRWQIDTRNDRASDLRHDCELKVLENFDAEHEWLLEPGDILYLPPGVAHWGIAEGACITCSIGYRAPALREILGSWAEFLNQSVSPDDYYRDAIVEPQAFSAEITSTTFDAIDELITKLTRAEKDDKRRWFGEFITEVKPHLTPEPPEQALDPDHLYERFRARSVVYRHPYSRAAFAALDGERLGLFFNGDTYVFADRFRGFVNIVAHEREMHFGYLAEWLEYDACRQVLAQLYNAGYLVFDYA